MSSVLRWRPIREFVTLRDAMDRLLEDSFVQPSYGRRLAERERVMRLPLDAYATDKELIIIADVSGATPEDVDITIEGDTLTIKGEFRPPLENVDYLFQERAYGPFSRSVILNIPVQADKAEAGFDNGLLTLTIPKAEAVRPKTIKVKSK